MTPLISDESFQLLCTMVVGGVVGALMFTLFKRRETSHVKPYVAVSKNKKFKSSFTNDPDAEEVGNTHVLEATHRMKGFEVPPTPKNSDPETKLKQLKGSLAYVSAVANALGDMTRDLGADAFMDMAVEEASIGVVTREGGPFGAVIVMKDKDTGEERVTAIRKACARLGTFDLSACTLYTSCYPCPMCYGAIHWAKIPTCVYAAKAEDAARAGFDDEFIYASIRGTAHEEHCEFICQPHKGAVDVFHQNYEMY